MKTRKEFMEQLRTMKQELKDAIRIELADETSALWYNHNGNENEMTFIENATGLESETEIDHIYIGSTEISVYPKDQDKYAPMHLTEIENVHDLMLIHYIATEEKDEIL